MAYLQHTSWKDRPGAVAGVIAIHALLGYGLINGLGFVGVIPAVPPNVQSTYIPDIPLPPPPKPVEDPKTDVVPARDPVAPLPPLDLSDRRPLIETTEIVLPPLPDVPRVIPSPTPTVDAGPRKPAFDPVGPRPRNDPGAWVMTSDYKTSWINREWTGTARFRLEIAASGKVAGCTITGSSGHAELDKATCDLVTRRARFEPARDGAGARIGGRYSGAVSWVLPD